MRVSELTHNDVLYVAAHMREWDRREIYASRWDDDPVALTESIMLMGAFSWICGLDRPIAAIGAYPIYPGVWSCWMFATDEIKDIRVSLTRFVKRDMVNALLRAGAHRVECRSMEGHTDAHEWLKIMGVQYEATHPMAGKNGETFHTFAWVRK